MTTETTEPATALVRGIQPCAGPCGRSTRPSKWPAGRAPGTVPRKTGGLCGSCITKGYKAERQLSLAEKTSPERVDRMTTDLDAFMQRMRRSSIRLATKRT